MAMAGENALVQAVPSAVRDAGSGPPNPSAQPDTRWKRVQGFACELTVDLRVPAFKITDLLKLRLGSIVDAGWRTGQDIPLCLNGTRIGWVEFDVVSNHLAVRMTELA
jgi:flagellar motor switch/type III secretory pathway protein FliN